MGEAIVANVAIIGAGPAGTAAAAHLGQLGVQDVVLVDKHDFPRDKTCGSAISPRGIQTLKALGLWSTIEPKSYRISGLRLVAPGGKEICESAGEAAHAIVCNRRIFDHEILKRATSLGTTFIPCFVAERTIEEGGRTKAVVARDGRTIRAKYVLVAGGAHCRAGVTPRTSRRLIHAIMGWWEGVRFTPHVIEMIFDRTLAPYYGWLFPENDERVNIGITYPDQPTLPNARELFAHFLDKHYRGRLRDARRIGDFKGHPVAYSLQVGDLTAPGKLLIGEAALLTHPATAEGIYQGMRSGMLAAEAVADVLMHRTSEAKALKRYERRCKTTFQLAAWAGELFRRSMQTPLLDWVMAAGEKPLMKRTAAKVLAAL